MRMRHLVIGTMLLLGGLNTNAAAADGELDAAHVLNISARANAAVTPSVSEQEAKLWILNSGYDQVSGLVAVGPGIYQGTALSNGDTYDVVVDSAGNVLGVKE
ncbi:MAG: hypothetical protein HYU58_11545 [Proteobacteria bacterium]|nr:hypothetical protein [Pseudomonadota bacterium]